MNRLAREASPYLQQHAKNPVDWFPWGEEALARARDLDRPILLSVGYSACHWCHVMERESFEDQATADVMNELFVSIKVDREERPDLDQVYQVAVQLLGRSGGWPLTAFLTPDGRPFFAGTYFPPKARYGMPGFSDVLRAVAEAFQSKRGEIDAQADEMTRGVRAVTGIETRADREGKNGYVLGPDILAHATAKLAARFDDENGGFGERPKFPNTMALAILQRRGVLEGDAVSAHRVRRALEAMRSGGIHDQLGGGFHRYSTDASWRVPHFEKMLYDNALLLRAFADSWRAFRDPDDKDTAAGIVDYLAREMTGKDGAFFATQDADSEGEEGTFFIWTRDQMSEVLADDPAAREVAIAAYGVTAAGNFAESHVAGATVLSRKDRKADAAGTATALTTADRDSLARARTKLFLAREKRVKPFRDEKVIAGWNGLMIGALADAAAAFERPDWLARAEAAFAAVMDRLASEDAPGTKQGGLRLQRLYKDDVVRGPGFLDDYAYLAAAALDLYEASGNATYASTARQLADAIVTRFAAADARDGFFFTPSDGETLIHRSRDLYDQAVPNGAATALDVLLKLGTLVDPQYGERAEAALVPLAFAAVQNPLGMGTTVLALDRLVHGSVDVVLVGGSEGMRDPRLQALAVEAWRAYVPRRTIAWLDPADAATREACAQLAAGKDGQVVPVAYVCRNRTCSLPIADAGALAAELAKS